MAFKPYPPISSFTGDHKFLSNFFHSPLTVVGVSYYNVEAAFQAAKTLDLDERKKFSLLNGRDAKALGRKVKLRADWDFVRVEIMELCLRAKFSDPALAPKLVATGLVDLIEGNTWNDTYWGVCNGKGHNTLGKLLMNIREDLSRTS